LEQNVRLINREIEDVASTDIDNDRSNDETNIVLHMAHILNTVS
jgi:hypothetical protein